MLAVQGYGDRLVQSFGYLYPPEMAFLKDVSRRLFRENPRVVNIGIGAATSIYGIYEARPDSEIVAVDIDPLMGISQLREGGIAQFVRLVHGDSKEIGKTWSLPVDLLFIDGDHSYEGCYGDLAAWTPHLTDGAAVLIHDYHSENWPAVKRAVDEFLAGWHLIGHVETLIAFSRFDTYWLEV